MARSLDSSRFTFDDNCREEDLDEIVRMFLDGTGAFPDWPYIVGDTPPEELFNWARETFFRPKLTDPIMNIFLIREISTGLPRAYGMLKWPDERQLTETPENPYEKQAADANTPSTINQKFLKPWVEESIRELQASGYDPTLHFRRLGTTVHADFQGQGLGSIMTQRLNDVADEYEGGRATYVALQKRAQSIFTKLGYERCGTVRFDLSEFGGPEVLETALFRREPRAGKAQSDRNVS